MSTRKIAKGLKDSEVEIVLPARTRVKEDVPHVRVMGVAPLVRTMRGLKVTVNVVSKLSCFSPTIYTI